MIYKLYIAGYGSVANAAMTVNAEPQVSFIFDPANTDYENFKAQINAGTAQLEDADGNLMTPDEAKAYVATLP
jgi:hypothetical protein